MVSLLFDLVFGTVLVYAFVGLIGLVVISLVLTLISSAVGRLASIARLGSPARLRWSRPVDEVATALAGEQAIAFSVRWRRGVRARHLQFMLVPLDDLPQLERESQAPGRWHIFCPDISRACTAALPWSGRELVTQLEVPSPDARAGAEALDAIMSRMVGLLWGAS
jgi:hypothetical protein